MLLKFALGIRKVNLGEGLRGKWVSERSGSV